MVQRATEEVGADFIVAPTRAFRGLMVILALLAAAHFAVTFVDVMYLNGRDPTGLVRFVRMGTEANLPTFYSTLLLLIAGLLLSVVALIRRRAADRFSLHWIGLATGFFFLALDEAAQFHEGVLGRFLGSVFGRGDGVLRYLWYLVYIPIVAVIGVGYLRFLKALPAGFRRRCIVAGSLFLGGAIGLELFEAVLAGNHSDRSWLWISHGFEESAEIAGVSVFIVALLRYLGDERIHPSLTVAAPPHSG